MGKCIIIIIITCVIFPVIIDQYCYRSSVICKYYIYHIELLLLTSINARLTENGIKVLYNFQSL